MGLSLCDLDFQRVFVSSENVAEYMGRKIATGKLPRLESGRFEPKANLSGNFCTDLNLKHLETAL